MREFQERRRMKKLLHSRYVIALLLVVFLLLAHAVWGVYGKYEKSKEIALRMQNDLAGLESREKSLTDSLNSLGTEEGKERELRDRFGVVKDGERMIVIVDDTATKSPATVTQSGWWSRFLSFFGI